MTSRSSATARLLLALTVLTASPIAADTFLVSSALTPGKNGTTYVTDIRIAGLPGARVDATFYGSSSKPAPVTAAPVTLPVSGALTIHNALETLFGLSSPAYGPIRLSSASPMLVSANVLVQGGSCGEVGFNILGLTEDFASLTAVFPAVTSDAGHRVNVILFNTSPGAAVVTLGLPLSQAALATITLAPNGFAQINDVGAALGITGDFVLGYQSSRPIMGLATVIDNGSAQAFALPAIPVSL